MKIKKVVSFYVFEAVKTKCFSKLGKDVSYDRTARVDKKDLIQNIISQLQSAAMHYLIHHFFIINDFTYWRRFLSETEHYTLWLDYPQNINFTKKRQVQSAHFSGRQHTLHSTVLQAPKNGKHSYIYHLPDDTSQDTVMTFGIIKDIIHCHPEVIQDKVLILRSDNCQEHYKCKYTFF